MVLRCKECGKTRKKKICVLFPTQGFIKETIHFAHCDKCDKDIIKLFSLKSDGNIQTREIIDTKFFLKNRMIDYIESPIVSIGKWRRAKGYAYLKGYRYKNSAKGVILNFSDDSIKEKFTAR